MQQNNRPFDVKQALIDSAQSYFALLDHEIILQPNIICSRIIY